MLGLLAVCSLPAITIRLSGTMTNLFELNDDVAVVIGGTGELGGHMAEALGSAGAKIAVVGRNAERGQARADAIIAAGATPFGMYALNSLRIEKGYRTWKGDLSTDYTLFEGGLDRFVKLDKPQDFPGKAALMNEKQQGSKKRFVTLIVDAGAQDAPYMSTLWHNGEVVGETTSGDWGYRVNASIALGMVRTDLAEPGTELEVEIYGQKRLAKVQADQPLWDPQNERLRA